MVKYLCTHCNYETNRKTDMSRHNKSKTHLQKVHKVIIDTSNIPSAYNPPKKIYKCQYCDNEYSNSSALARHKKSCTEGITKNNENVTLKKENERLQKQVESYEIIIKSLTTPQCVNYYNYICTAYPNSKALEDKKAYNKLLEAKTMTLIEVIVMYHNNNQLVSFIGDYIIKTYKKENPKDQSLWTTDMARLTYIISEICKDRNIWIYDKKGVKVKKIIIEPVLQYIKDQLLDFCRDNSTATDEPEFSQLRAALEIIPMINSGVLATDITKYIAPEFAINNNDAHALVKV